MLFTLRAALLLISLVLSTAPTQAKEGLFALENACIRHAEIIAGERLLVDVRDRPRPASRELKARGEWSGVQYQLTCAGKNAGADRVASSNVNWSRASPTAAARLNNATLRPGRARKIRDVASFSGEVDGPWIDKIFGSILVRVRSPGSYCLYSTSQKTVSGGGSSSVALDGSPWFTWHHTVDGGRGLTNPTPPIVLSAGRHLLYLAKRESKVGQIMIRRCPE